MKRRRWTKKQIERYCKKIIGTVPIIHMVSKKNIRGFSAISYNTIPQYIYFGERKFERAMLWHECGHLMGIQPGSRYCHWTSERDAQLNAIRRALDMGFINIAKELIQWMEECFDKTFNGLDYLKACQETLKELDICKL